MKHHLLKLLAVALCATPLFGVPATGEPESNSAAVESEIRQELNSLRARLLKLEAMLDSLNEEETAPAVATSVEPVGASPSTGIAETADPTRVEPLVADVGYRNATWTPPKAVTDAEPSQETPVGVASSGGQSISITGLLDTYLAYNTNKPENGYNDLYYTNPNSRGFGLNQAKLEIDASGDGPIGFRTDIWFGSGARLFVLEPNADQISERLYLQQAYGYYQFDNGAELDVGLFGTIAGLEVAESHLNWNYSRGILWAWNEPFGHLGAKFSAPLTDTFTGTVMLVNGFDNTWDQNSGKSYGVQGSFAPSDSFNTTLTWINGPENWGTNQGWLKNVSWNFYGMVHERFEVMGNLDYIQNNDEFGSYTSWGLGGYARAHLSDQVRIAYRAEFMDDREARSTGVNQTLKENTITFEVQPLKDDPRFLTRIEYRRDWSDVPYFLCTECGDGGLSMDQNTFTLGFMWVFGPKE